MAEKLVGKRGTRIGVTCGITVGNGAAGALRVTALLQARGGERLRALRVDPHQRGLRSRQQALLLRPARTPRRHHR